MNLKALTIWFVEWGARVLVVLALFLCLDVPVHAATIQVGCDVNALINAITAANASTEADTLELSAGCVYTLTAVNNTDEMYGPNGLPVIMGELTLNGNGATITRVEDAPKFRFFQTPDTATLTLNQLTLEKGELEGSSYEQSPYPGGAIYNLGTLTLADCVLENNWADERGGGIYNVGGALTITHSTFSKHRQGNHGNATSRGGAIFSQNGIMTIKRSEFTDNVAWNAGGAIFSEGSLSVEDSRFLGNSVNPTGTDAGGGAIYSWGTLFVTTSTFDGNSAMSFGGALYIFGTATVSESTFVRNSATGAHGSGGGGAIYSVPIYTTVDVFDSTFNENFAGYYALGAAINSGGTIVNSIFSLNPSETLYGSGITGAVLKNSIVHETTCNSVFDGGGNIYWPKSNNGCPGRAGNPKLALIADNGGPTETMALGVDSGALDAAVEGNCPATDQRGISRPQGPHCDIGAFELELGTVDQTDLNVTFGHWRNVDLGGWNVLVSNHKSDTVTFKFQGRKVKWQTRRGPSYGMAQVMVDGQDKGTVDVYSPLQIPSILSFGRLGTGKHKLTIRVLGEKRTEATDTNVAIYKFVAAGNATLPPAPNISFNDWREKKDSMAIGGTYRANADPDVRGEFIFDGPGIQWVTAMGPAYGKAKIYIDGTQRGGTWDLYSPNQTWRVAIPFGGLSDGQHTFVVVVQGNKNSLSTGASVIVDAFRLPVLH